jgi:hypothetical protein
VRHQDNTAFSHISINCKVGVRSMHCVKVESWRPFRQTVQ